MKVFPECMPAEQIPSECAHRPPVERPRNEMTIQVLVHVASLDYAGGAEEEGFGVVTGRGSSWGSAFLGASSLEKEVEV